MYFSATLEGSFLAVRHGQRKFIYDFGRTPIMAYDLNADPDELRPMNLTSDQRETAEREMLEWHRPPPDFPCSLGQPTSPALAEPGQGSDVVLS
jgi:hypothetical protein